MCKYKTMDLTKTELPDFRLSSYNGESVLIPSPAKEGEYVYKRKGDVIKVTNRRGKELKRRQNVYTLFSDDGSPITITISKIRLLIKDFMKIDVPVFKCPNLYDQYIDIEGNIYSFLSTNPHGKIRRYTKGKYFGTDSINLQFTFFLPKGKGLEKEYVEENMTLSFSRTELIVMTFIKEDFDNEDEDIIFIDGDKNNVSLENLKIVKKLSPMEMLTEVRL